MYNIHPPGHPPQEQEQDAGIENYAYAVLITDQSHNYLCAGSLVNDIFVLTLAECVRSHVKTPSELTVRVGGLGPTGMGFKVSQVQLHPKLDENRTENIAMVHLNESVSNHTSLKTGFVKLTVLVRNRNFWLNYTPFLVIKGLVGFIK